MANFDHRPISAVALCWATLHVFAFGSSADAADNSYYEGVSSEAVRCISENIDAYRRTGRPIIVIRPDSCPETDLLAGSQEGLTNMLPGKSFYGNSNEEPATKGSPSIVYTQKQLGCLAAQVAKGPLSVLPRKPCSNQ
ncbi:hypothetical protein [uncultured Hoeflea sp.]|uniref:hypothetical protein n=1 Tax=uncultured Hoeflea sp. TaxID=538666 RepID=UPI0030EF3622